MSYDNVCCCYGDVASAGMNHDADDTGHCSVAHCYCALGSETTRALPGLCNNSGYCAISTTQLRAHVDAPCMKDFDSFLFLMTKCLA